MSDYRIWVKVPMVHPLPKKGIRLGNLGDTIKCQISTWNIYSQMVQIRAPVLLSMWGSVVPFSSCLQSFPASGSFPMTQFFASGGQSIGVSASTLVLPMNTQDWSPLGWTDWISLHSKGLSRIFPNTTVQKYQFFSTQLLSEYLGYSTWPLHTSSCQSFVLLSIVSILMNVFFEKVPAPASPPPAQNILLLPKETSPKFLYMSCRMHTFR